jgi:hypothetical protein
MTRKTLMLAVALLAVIAAVLVLTLGGSSKHHASRAASAGVSQSAAASAASYLGLDTATVRRRLRSGETLEQIAESTPGHSSQGLLHAVLAKNAAELAKQGLSPAAVRAKQNELRAKLNAKLRRKARVRGSLAAASSYLGISEQQLRSQVRSGHTLAQIAIAHGHTPAQLVEGMVKVRRARLEAAVKAGQITAGDERLALHQLRKRIARQIEAKLD